MPMMSRSAGGRSISPCKAPKDSGPWKTRSPRARPECGRTVRHRQRRVPHGTEIDRCIQPDAADGAARSEEHTSELQSLMRISYAVFCLKKNKSKTTIQPTK